MRKSFWRWQARWQARRRRYIPLFADADLTFRPALDRDGNEHPITQGSYIAAMESPDRTLRKNAFESLYAGFGAYKNTVAAMLSGQVKQLEFFSKARRYASPLWKRLWMQRRFPWACIMH